VCERIRAEALWGPGDRVAVAVSGGLDSVVLLDLLVQTQTWHKGVLSVVTVDHGTRPGSSDDAAMVAQMAAELGLTCRVASLALGPDAAEATCRTARFEVFSALECTRVALAHHADDQAATVLLQLLRGAGTRGLGAMRARRGRVVRPLLGCRKETLLAWAHAHNLTWCEDPTNRSSKFLRNRVRDELLPAMEELRPGAVEALARGAGLAAEDDALLEVLAAGLPQAGQSDWSTAWVAETSPALVGRVLRNRVPDLDAGQLQALREMARRGHGRLELRGQEAVEVAAGRVRLVKIGAGRPGTGG
jgi:tRNA(Ile)-lysidine synthase